MTPTIGGFVALLITLIIAFFYVKGGPRPRVNRVAGDEESEEGVSLIVERIKTPTDMFRSYQVLLDGEVVGEVRNGQSLALSPASGPHSLEVQIGPIFAREDVMIDDHVTRALVGRGRAVGGNAWTKPVIVAA